MSTASYLSIKIAKSTKVDSERRLILILYLKSNQYAVQFPIDSMSKNMPKKDKVIQDIEKTRNVIRKEFRKLKSQRAVSADKF